MNSNISITIINGNGNGIIPIKGKYREFGLKEKSRAHAGLSMRKNT